MSVNFNYRSVNRTVRAPLDVGATSLEEGDANNDTLAADVCNPVLFVPY